VLVSSDLPAVEERQLGLGCSVTTDYLELCLKKIDESAAMRDPTLCDYLIHKQKFPDRLLITAMHNRAEQVLPQEWMLCSRSGGKNDPEPARLERTAFLDKAALTNGTSQHRCGEQVYRIVPETHGMAEIIKRNQEALVSHVRLFCSDLEEKPLYLRVRENVFEKACAHALDLSHDPSRQPTRLSDIKVHITYQGTSELAIGAAAMRAATRPHDPDGYDKIHRVSVCLKVWCLFPPDTLAGYSHPCPDVFLADVDVLGVFMPGLDHIDPLLPHPKDPTKEARIKFLEVKQYLKHHHKERSAIKDNQEIFKQKLAPL